jgi:zinc transport system substrate-binding protein
MRETSQQKPGERQGPRNGGMAAAGWKARRPWRLLVLVLALLAALAAPLPANAASAPVVVTDIRPVRELLAALMKGRGTPPVALLAQEEDPHHAALRPSQMRRLVHADVIFVISREMSPGLARLLDRPGVRERVIELARAEGIELLPRRRLDPPGAGSRAPEGTDWHVWTDPRLVFAMGKAAVAELIRLDPQGASVYRANLSRLAETLEALDRMLGTRLPPLRERPFLLVHDATQYLERRYGLRPLAVVQPDHEHPPGPRRLAALLRLVRQNPGICILSPPGGAGRWARRLAEAGEARTAVVDVLGTTLGAIEGVAFWQALFSRLGEAYETCLGQNSRSDP